MFQQVELSANWNGLKTGNNKNLKIYSFFLFNSVYLMKTKNNDNMKRYFNSKKEAIEVFKERKTYVEGVYKVKHGRHKNQWFVGTYMEFLNIY